MFMKLHYYSLLVVLLVFYVSCSKKPGFNIVGTWNSSIQYERELSQKDNLDIPIATVRTAQDNEMTFYSDGFYSRTIHEYFLSAESYSPDYSEDFFVESCGALDNSVVLKGTYEIHGEKLTLITTTAYVVSENKTIPYDEFYKEIKSYGKAKIETKLTFTKDGGFMLQGIPFTSATCRNSFTSDSQYLL